MTRIIEQDTPETLARVALLETKLAGAVDELRDARALLAASQERERELRATIASLGDDIGKADAALNASQERERRMREALERLNRKGGLGYEIHDAIDAALAPVPETPPRVTPEPRCHYCNRRMRDYGHLCVECASARANGRAIVRYPDPATPETPKAAPPTLRVPAHVRPVWWSAEGNAYDFASTSAAPEAAPRALEPDEDDEPSREPTCSTCNDTHWMSLTAFGQQVPCSQCPLPCKKCGNLTGFCRETPCSCDCHPRAAPTPETAGEARPESLTTKRIVDLTTTARMLLSTLENLAPWNSDVAEGVLAVLGIARETLGMPSTPAPAPDSGFVAEDIQNAIRARNFAIASYKIAGEESPIVHAIDGERVTAEEFRSHFAPEAPTPEAPVSPLVRKKSGGSTCVAHWVPTPKPEDGE